ncbi:hypothetical protein [Gracilibacillus thailandensis]|nr:hypothetical protein [Gracilibacillus thailandensis]
MINFIDPKPTMSLRGGVDMYSLNFDRYGSETPPTGRKVRFLNENGYEFDKEHARKHINEGDILTVKEIYVGRSSSEVEFEEIPNQKFNTVMFEDI